MSEWEAMSERHELERLIASINVDIEEARQDIADHLDEKIVRLAWEDLAELLVQRQQAMDSLDRL